MAIYHLTDEVCIADVWFKAGESVELNDDTAKELGLLVEAAPKVTKKTTVSSDTAGDTTDILPKE